jgi:hypothetical protein
MDRRVCLGFAVLVLSLVVGCGQSPSSSGPAASADATNSAALSDPAAQVANEYLDALVKGDTPRAVSLYTPLAAERMQQFPLPGIADYSFRVIGTEHPSSDKALVACQAKGVSPTGQNENEDMCLLLQSVNGQWRVSGMAFNPDPQQPPVIFSFEAPDRGPIPLQQWLAEARAGGDVARPSPRTAQDQEVVPAGAYR